MHTPGPGVPPQPPSADSTNRIRQDQSFVPQILSTVYRAFDALSLGTLSGVVEPARNHLFTDPAYKKWIGRFNEGSQLTDSLQGQANEAIPDIKPNTAMRDDGVRLLKNTTKLKYAKQITPKVVLNGLSIAGQGPVEAAVHNRIHDNTNADIELKIATLNTKRDRIIANLNAKDDYPPAEIKETVEKLNKEIHEAWQAKFKHEKEQIEVLFESTDFFKLCNPPITDLDDKNNLRKAALDNVTQAISDAEQEYQEENNTLLSKLNADLAQFEAEERLMQGLYARYEQYGYSESILDSTDQKIRTFDDFIKNAFNGGGFLSLTGLSIQEQNNQLHMSIPPANDILDPYYQQNENQLMADYSVLALALHARYGLPINLNIDGLQGITSDKENHRTFDERSQLVCKTAFMASLYQGIPLKDLKLTVNGRELEAKELFGPAELQRVQTIAGNYAKIRQMYKEMKLKPPKTLDTDELTPIKDSTLTVSQEKPVGQASTTITPLGQH